MKVMKNTFLKLTFHVLPDLQNDLPTLPESMKI